MKFTCAVVPCAVVCLFTASLHAQGIVLAQMETRGGKTSTDQIQIDKNAMRTESIIDQTSVTFDGSIQTMRMFDIGKKTYTEITKGDLERIKSQQDRAWVQLQAYMATLPPSQRQIQEKMAKAWPVPGNAAASELKPEFRAAGSGRVGPWTCEKYEGFVGQEKTVEVCAVDPGVLNLAASDFDIVRQLSEFLKPIAPDRSDRLVLNGSVQDQGYPGVAVRRATFKNGTVDTVSEISEIRREAIPAATFELPSGYREVDLIPGVPGAH